MTEQKTVWKWFWVWEFEKEEQWLNAMAMDGWALRTVGFCRYTFERCEPGQYIIRCEMHPMDEAYVSFMEQTGAQYVGRMVAWIYFRRPAELGQFDLYSDIDSRITHLRRIATTLTAIGLMNLGIGVMNTVNVTRLGIINLLCATLLMYALGRIHGKIEALEKNRSLQE